MIGITGFGAYIPRARLSKQSMVEANAWFDGGLKALGKGECAMCNWDEDSITMAVEAAQDCLSCLGKADIEALYFASTTFPFLDRQNSVVLREALNLNENMRTMDVSASQRASTSALISLLERRTTNNSIVVASEHRRTKAASRAEMLWGDAAAALAIEQDNVIAEFLGAESAAVDFVDHYRGEDCQTGLIAIG